MRIEMTVNCGWTEMLEKLVPPEKVDGVLGRIEARGDDMPQHDSPDPQEREDAEWVNEMCHGRQWARRMGERMREVAQQGVLLPLLPSDDTPIDSGFNSDNDCNEPDWENIEEGLWEEILWEEYCGLMMRTDDRGGTQPDPASEDEQEREDALWLAQIEADEANLELAKCEAVKKEVDERQSLPPSRITSWDRALKARPFLRTVE